MFEDSLVESKISGAKKTTTVAISALAHVVVVAALIIVPLMVTDALPAGGGTGIGGILLAPGWGSAPDIAPPPPRGAATARASTPVRSSADAVELVIRDVPVIEDAVTVAQPSIVLPRAVPESIAGLSGEGDPLGVDGGVPNGIAGGRVGGNGNSLNGDLGGVGDRPCGPLGCGTGGDGFGPGLGRGLVPGLVDVKAPPPPPAVIVAVRLPPPPPPVNIPAPPVIRISEGMQKANCLRCPAPEYPALARTARVTDTVVLSARINKQGMIEDLTVVRGHVLLRDASLGAVRGWLYKPMLLNGEPVDVQTTISISFVFR